MKHVLTLLALLSLFESKCCLPVYAQDSTIHSSQVRKFSILPVPAFGYTPETKTYIGAVALMTFNLYQDSLTRISNAKLEFNYSWRKQIIAELGWNYFFRHEQWFTQGTLHYSKYPDYYYGIGAEEEHEVLYESNRTNIDLSLLKKVAYKTFAGLKVRYIDYSIQERYDTAIYYPELSDASIGGLGLMALIDSRDNLLNASKGIFVQCAPVFNLYKETVYSKLYLDLRHYTRPISSVPSVIAAFRLYNEFTIGTPPFFDYALLGGDKIARGYFYGRYRNKNLGTLQAEARSILLWRFGLAIFGGVSAVYPSFDMLAINDLKYNYGVGLRFLIDRKQNINLRLDYARGNKGQSGFYIAFGESF